MVMSPRTSASAALLGCAVTVFIFGIGGAGMAGIGAMRFPLGLGGGPGIGAGILAMFCGGGGGSGAICPVMGGIWKGMIC